MSYIAKQISMNEYEIDDLKSFARRLADNCYQEYRFSNGLPAIRNRHEAYGFIAEQMISMGKSQKTLKTAAGDCESMLAATDIQFAQASGDLYDAAIGLIADGITLAMHTQNVSFEISELVRNQTTPIEDMISGMADEVEALAEIGDIILPEDEDTERTEANE